jgi:protein tyrosine/serine phosphatase
MRHSFSFLVVAFIHIAALSGCAGGIHGDADLPNFQRVSDSLYRGGQPTRAGAERLQAMGVKTIINLRRSETNRAVIDDLDFEYHRRGMSPWSPSDEDVLWFLALASDPELAPVFVHCHHGSDRTGYLIAMYRIVIEGWDHRRAIEEMTAHGNGFHDIFQGLVSYVRKADADELRRSLAIRTALRPSSQERSSADRQIAEQPPPVRGDLPKVAGSRAQAD